MKFLSFLCTKWMENCEAMTSSTHSFAYSYGLVKKCFLKICEILKCHNFLIFQPIFIRFSLFCSENFTLSSKIKLDQVRTSPLMHQFDYSCFALQELVVTWHLYYKFLYLAETGIWQSLSSLCNNHINQQTLYSQQLNISSSSLTVCNCLFQLFKYIL